MLIAGSAQAHSTVQTSDTLADVNGTNGTVTVATVTDAIGRAITVTGPGGGANR